MDDEKSRDFLYNNRIYILAFSALYFLILSIFFLEIFFETHYPLSFLPNPIFEISNEIERYYISSWFMSKPFHLYTLFFSFSFFSFIFISRDDSNSLLPFIAILNGAFCIPLFFIPALKLNIISSYHLIYVILSFLILASIRKTDFKLPKNLIFLIFPIIFFLTNYTIRKITMTRSNAIPLNTLELRKKINIRDAKYIIERESGRYISPKHENVRVKIKVFADFNCEFCEELNKEIEDIRLKHGNSISIEYFAFPSSSICNPYYDSNAIDSGELACLMSKFALCAKKQSFPATFKLMAANKDELTIESIKERAELLGYHLCMRFNDADDFLREDLELAKSLNITQPTIFINGIEVPKPYDNGKIKQYFYEMKSRTIN